MTIARVFPRRTKATPVDALSFVGYPDLYTPPVDEVHVSVSFTWDLQIAEKLAKAWEPYGRLKIGGPATGMRGEEFTPGMYLRPGYVITSRGCPRNCYFCRVPIVDGFLRELPITVGLKIQDDNLLACSRDHFESVIQMLHSQKGRAEFTGGLDADLLRDWHVEALASLSPKPSVFFAFDPGDAYEPLAIAARKMIAAGFTAASHRLRCYVLIGYPRDTTAAALARMSQMVELGFTPMAMLWKHSANGEPISGEWRAFQRLWARPEIIHSRDLEAVGEKGGVR